MPGNEKMWVNGNVETDHPRNTYGEGLEDTIFSVIGPLQSFADLLDETHGDFEGAATAGNVLHSLVENAERKLKEYSDALSTHYGKALYTVRQRHNAGNGVPGGTLLGVKEYDRITMEDCDA